MDISMLRERGDKSAFTVSELNNYIKSIFESDRRLSSVTVKGEISNFVAHRSGHFYFSLKDAEGQLRAVMFRSSAMRLKFLPESGMKVIISGSVTVYPRDGSYQIYVNSMQPDGIGALYLAYEQLKERLMSEGLFDESNKKALPKYPKRIGVITSPTGAAVRDILNVTARRYPLADIYLYPALVQGEGAEASLIRGVDYFDKSGLADVVIIGRGGGSIEDLWAFNSEALARRIFVANVPIVSAVGHEIDFTICDFVSDLRAPTPSAAAEIVVPDLRELLLRIDGCSERAVIALERSIERAYERLDRVKSSRCFVDIQSMFMQRYTELDGAKDRLSKAVGELLRKTRDRLALNAEKLSVMNPLAVLSRGYSITESRGEVLRGVEGIKCGDEIKVILRDGSISAKVLTVEKKED